MSKPIPSKAAIRTIKAIEHLSSVDDKARALDAFVLETHDKAVHECAVTFYAMTIEGKSVDNISDALHALKVQP